MSSKNKLFANNFHFPGYHVPTSLLIKNVISMERGMDLSAGAKEKPCTPYKTTMDA